MKKKAGKKADKKAQLRTIDQGELEQVSGSSLFGSIGKAFSGKTIIGHIKFGPGWNNLL